MKTMRGQWILEPCWNVFFSFKGVYCKWLHSWAWKGAQRGLSVFSRRNSTKGQRELSIEVRYERADYHVWEYFSKY